MKVSSDACRQAADGCRMSSDAWCHLTVGLTRRCTAKHRGDNFRCITLTNVGKTPNFLGAQRGSQHVYRRTEKEAGRPIPPFGVYLGD